MANRFDNLYRMVMQIRSAGLSSRPKLAEELDLNLPAVSSLSRELIDRGLLIEEGYAKSDGGRRAAYLKINPQFGYAIGVAFRQNSMQALFMDLGGTILDSTGVVAAPEAPDAAIKQLEAQVKSLIQKHAAVKPLGMGIAAAGTIDPGSGTISRNFPTISRWKDVNIVERLHTALNLPVHLDHDVQAATLAELRYGAARGVGSMIYLHIGTGIALGLVMNDEIYAGMRGNSGEFGHTIVEPGGPVCYCGNNGCLEAVAGPPALARQAQIAIKQGVQSTLSDHLDKKGEIQPLAIFEAAQQGDRLAVNLVTKAADSIGVALAGIVNVLNPAMLMLGGVCTGGYDVFNFELRRVLHINALPGHLRGLQVEMSHFKENASAVGAATLVFERMFREPAKLLTDD
ncbi:MAG TPA: ROK family protein [Planctomycetota bacterium]|nr:ROK family protein [Planctomycetota bacterium]